MWYDVCLHSIESVSAHSRSVEVFPPTNELTDATRYTGPTRYTDVTRYTSPTRYTLY